MRSRMKIFGVLAVCVFCMTLWGCTKEESSPTKDDAKKAVDDAASSAAATTKPGD